MTSSPAFAEHPEHTITVEPHEGTVTVRLGGEVIARSDRALTLREASYQPAFYLPREDCRAEAMRETEHSTHCPFKGDARYWTLEAGGETVENGAWAYDAPFDQMGEIAGLVSFDATKVNVREERG